MRSQRQAARGGVAVARSSSFGQVSPVVKWENEVVKLTADEAVCATKSEGKSEVDKAKTALRKILSGKEVMQEEAMAEAINGYFLAEKTVRQAANDLGVISKPKEVGGKWYWRLP
jgi:hypothetical protein